MQFFPIDGINLIQKNITENQAASIIQTIMSNRESEDRRYKLSHYGDLVSNKNEPERKMNIEVYLKVGNYFLYIL